MRKYFKGVSSKAADGWLLAVVTGYSMIDNQDWIIDTNSLHADQVPDACQDAATFAKFVSGLLNCYYNHVETKNLSENFILQQGEVDEETEFIPSPLNTELPF